MPSSLVVALTSLSIKASLMMGISVTRSMRIFGGTTSRTIFLNLETVSAMISLLYTVWKMETKLEIPYLIIKFKIIKCLQNDNGKETTWWNLSHFKQYIYRDISSWKMSCGFRIDFRMNLSKIFFYSRIPFLTGNQSPTGWRRSLISFTGCWYLTAWKCEFWGHCGQQTAHSNYNLRLVVGWLDGGPGKFKFFGLPQQQLSHLNFPCCP